MSLIPSVHTSELRKTGTALIEEVRTLRRQVREALSERDLAIKNLGELALENAELKRRLAVRRS